MTCTFFGQSDATDEIKNKLKECILYMINCEHVDMFLVGNNGNFDFFTQCSLQELKNEGICIDYAIILSRLGETALSKNQRATLFPEKLDDVIPKYAIPKRNSYLIDNSSFVIAYARHRFGNSYKWITKASKRGLRIINLADEDSYENQI